jgi:uncharacterized protein (DUF433 family)
MMGAGGTCHEPSGDRAVTDPDANEFLERLQSDPAILGGQVCIKGTRIPVSLILDMLAGGDTVEELLDGYPTITREDIAAALAYGGWLARERILPLARHS